jgi:uncharacterized protein (TIGR02145 family)
MRSQNVFWWPRFLNWGVALGIVLLPAGCSKDDSTPVDPAAYATEGTVTDVDGNVYKTAKIGNQWWMLENLRVTHYRNGEPVPAVSDRVTWANLTTGACCCYENLDGDVATYGRLYNWFAVSDPRGLAPQGWHVPTDAEWQTLERFLGMDQTEARKEEFRGTNEGGKLKVAGTAHWNSPNTGATNEVGFSALPNGGRSVAPGYGGNYYYRRERGTFWTATAYSDLLAWYRHLYYDHAEIYRYYNQKGTGFSVRCVRD